LGEIDAELGEFPSLSKVVMFFSWAVVLSIAPQMMGLGWTLCEEALVVDHAVLARRIAWEQSRYYY
jgi:hypothetical protein